MTSDQHGVEHRRAERRLRRSATAGRDAARHLRRPSVASRLPVEQHFAARRRAQARYEREHEQRFSRAVAAEHDQQLTAATLQIERVDEHARRRRRTRHALRTQRHGPPSDLPPRSAHRRRRAASLSGDLGLRRRQCDAPAHDLRGDLRVQRLALRVGIAVRDSGAAMSSGSYLSVAPRVCSSSCAMTTLLRLVVLAIGIGVYDADEALGETERVRESRVRLRIVVDDEHADVGRRQRLIARSVRHANQRSRRLHQAIAMGLPLAGGAGGASGDLPP